MRIFLPTLSLSEPVTSCKIPHMPGCNAFNRPISFVVKAKDEK